MSTRFEVADGLSGEYFATHDLERVVESTLDEDNDMLPVSAEALMRSVCYGLFKGDRMVAFGRQSRVDSIEIMGNEHQAIQLGTVVALERGHNYGAELIRQSTDAAGSLVLAICNEVTQEKFIDEGYRPAQDPAWELPSDSNLGRFLLMNDNAMRAMYPDWRSEYVGGQLALLAGYGPAELSRAPAMIER